MSTRDLDLTIAAAESRGREARRNGRPRPIGVSSVCNIEREGWDDADRAMKAGATFDVLAEKISEGIARSSKPSSHRQKDADDLLRLLKRLPSAPCLTFAPVDQCIRCGLTEAEHVLDDLDGARRALAAKIDDARAELAADLDGSLLKILDDDLRKRDAAGRPLPGDLPDTLQGWRRREEKT